MKLSRTGLQPRPRRETCGPAGPPERGGRGLETRAEQRLPNQGSSEQLDLDVAEFDAPALGLEPGMAPRNPASLPLVGHGPVDPESDMG